MILVSEYKVNKKKLIELYSELRAEEGNNLRTGRSDDENMRKYIIKQIEKIVKEEEKNEI